MPKFIYKIKYEDIEAENFIVDKDLSSAIKKIKENGYEIISIEEKMGFFQTYFGKKKLSTKDLITFFSTIAAMDSVGIDLTKSLKLLKEEIAIDNQIKLIYGNIYDNVMNGILLSDACIKVSSSFNYQIIGLVKIAEKTGKFYILFNSLVEYIKWQDDIKKKSKKAITGPLLTLVIMFGILILLSIFAIPKIVDFLKYFNMEPPFTTILLIKFSYFIRYYSWLPVVIIIAIKFLLKFFIKNSKQVTIAFDKFKLSLPLFGEILIKIDVNQFISFFVLMYNAGSDIMEILESIEKTMNNKFLSECVGKIKHDVENGTSIFLAIDNYKIFPAMFRKMMSVCELTGNPGATMMNIKNSYDKELNESIDTVVGAIKPIMTVVLGVMLAWIGTAMLGPIYSNIGNIK